MYTGAQIRTGKHSELYCSMSHTRRSFHRAIVNFIPISNAQNGTFSQSSEVKIAFIIARKEIM